MNRPTLNITAEPRAAHDANRAAIDRANEEMRLRLAAPKRADAGRYLTAQDDASDCPLFRAANEPRLF